MRVCCTDIYEERESQGRQSVVRSRDRHVQGTVFAQRLECLSDTEEVRTGRTDGPFSGRK